MRSQTPAPRIADTPDRRRPARTAQAPLVRTAPWELADPPTLRVGPHHTDRLVLAGREWRWDG